MSFGHGRVQRALLRLIEHSAEPVATATLVRRVFRCGNRSPTAAEIGSARRALHRLVAEGRIVQVGPERLPGTLPESLLWANNAYLDRRRREIRERESADAKRKREAAEASAEKLLRSPARQWMATGMGISGASRLARENANQLLENKQMIEGGLGEETAYILEIRDSCRTAINSLAELVKLIDDRAQR